MNDLMEDDTSLERRTADKWQQQNLRSLSTRIHLSQNELSLLLNDHPLNKLVEKVVEFNNTAIQLIAKQFVDEALVYLLQAEKILQVAVANNKKLQKKIVIVTLHNLACCFQKNWQLEQCSNYLEALIYNLNSSDSSINNFTPVNSSSDFGCLKSGSTLNMVNGIPQKAVDLMLSIQSKQRLGHYYLQFCAVNSQLQNHSGALIAARKSIETNKKMFKQVVLFLKHHNKRISKQSRQQFESKLRLVHQVSKINDNISISQYQMILETTKFYLKKWKSQQVSCIQQHLVQLENKFKNFSIGSIAQLNPINFDEVFCVSQQRKNQLVSIQGLMGKILVNIIGYFTISTQLRMISNMKDQQNHQVVLIEKQKQKSQTASVIHFKPQYRQAEVYHLFSIMLAAIFIPFQILYMKHILISYKNHFSPENLNDHIGHFGQQRLYQEFLFTISQIKKPSLLSLDFQDSLRISEIGKQILMCQGAGGTQIRFTAQVQQRNKRFSMLNEAEQKKKKKSPSVKHTKKSKSKSKSQSKNKKSTLKTVSALSAHSKTNKRQKMQSIPSSKSPKMHAEPSLGKNKKMHTITSPRSKKGVFAQSTKNTFKKQQKKLANKISQYRVKKSDVHQRKGKRKLNTNQDTNAYFLKHKQKSKSKKKSSTSASSKRNGSIQPSYPFKKQIIQSNPTDIYYHKVDSQRIHDAKLMKSKQKSKRKSFSPCLQCRNPYVKGAKNMKCLHVHFK